jgi:flagellar biosynthesis protein FlhG
VKTPASDQADGLRRLMANSPGRLLAFVAGSPAAGVSSVTRNLAAALARHGQDVHLLDESGEGPSRPVRRRGRLVLLDAVLGTEGTLSPLAARADEVVVVLRPQAEAITAAYACIKRLHHAHGLRRVRVLVNHAADAAEAQRILANLAGAAGRYLGLALEPAGCVSADPQVAEARALKLSVVEAFPGSPAAADFYRLASALLRWPVLPLAAEAGEESEEEVAPRLEMPRAFHAAAA